MTLAFLGKTRPAAFEPAVPKPASHEPAAAHEPAGTRAGAAPIGTAAAGADPAEVAVAALSGRSFGGPFTIRVAGSGRFGSVIWAGIGGDAAALSQLRNGIVTALAGFPLDAKEFRPHLTVSYRYSRQLLESLSGYNGPEWRVSSFHLVRSQAGHYSRIAEWTL
ncbi:2'-5' RNA ligase family protein [Actinoplanes sp. DH11]|uniref:2'-5' RNA ligase family protein n=1 Tax=Actinoplanes sp. DH11 TaxID=2857011 RepID=UPI001E321BB4